MIILKHDGAVYIAMSQSGIRDGMTMISGVPDTENLCVWHPDNKANRIVATNGGSRFTDMIRYADIFPSEMKSKNIINECYDKMYGIADNFGLCTGNVIPSPVIIAEDDRVFVIYTDGAHIEIEDVFSACGANEVTIALYDLKGASDPHEFFREAYKMIEKIDGCVEFPITVANTKSDKLELIYR